MDVLVAHPLVDGDTPTFAAPGDGYRIDVATTGGAALQALTGRPYDVLVARSWLPDVDCAWLLSVVRERWPKMVIVVATPHGTDDHQATMYAHSRTLYPFDATSLEVALLQAAALRGDLDTSLLASLLQRVGGLPVAPTIWLELGWLLSDDDVSAAEVTRVVQSDVSLVTHLLRQANSPWFNRGMRIDSVHDAVVRLGFVALRRLVLNAAITTTFAGARVGGVDAEALSERGLARGAMAARLVTQPADVDQAFLAGMLTDIGQLVTARFLPEENREVRALAARKIWPLHQAETLCWGVSHPVIGASLLRDWLLSSTVADAVAVHHQPVRPRTDGVIDVVTATHLAHLIVDGDSVAIEGIDPEDVQLWQPVIDRVNGTT